MVTDLMQPTVQRTSILQGDFETLKGIVSQHTKSLHEVSLTQVKAQEQVSTIDRFKEEMAKWDTQRRAQEVKLNESLQTCRDELEGFRYSIEQKESALHQLNRSVDRTVQELNRLQDAQAELRQYCEDRIDEQSKRRNHDRSELDVKIAALELRHDALTDELWSEETGLAKATGELKKTNLLVSKLEETTKELQTGKAEKLELDRVREEVGKLVRTANSSMTSLRQTVGNVVHDVKEHFRTASQTIASHNAGFIQEVRASYQDELANTAQLRNEVEGFLEKTRTDISAIDQRVAEATVRASALAAEAREEVDELNRKRKRDKTSSDNELKALKKRLGGVFDNSDAVLRGTEHIHEVMRMLLESDRLQSSLERQDALDRKKIALFGVRDEEARGGSAPSESQRTRPEGRSGKSPAPLRGKKDPVVRVDTRCLSCSGQSPLVLSAFKMACLKYEASPVEHDGRVHDREDLLSQRQLLLKRAYESLVTGPGGAGGLQTSVDAETMRAEVAAARDPEPKDALSEYAAYSGKLPQLASSAPTQRIVSAR